MTNPLFDPNTPTDPNIPENAAEALIGEGKKFKDVETAARSLLAKDAFIEQLKAENAQMRASLRGEQKIDEFLTKLAAQNATPPKASNEGQPPENTDANQLNNTQPPKGLTLTDVEEVFLKRERERTEAQNLNTVLAKVKEAFGADYQTVLSAKAQELGMSADELLVEAKTRPAAFLKLVEADKVSRPASGAPPRSQVNTSGFNAQNVPERTQAWYNKMRREIGDAKFFSPKIQNELHKDALRLGEAFFN